MKKFLKATLATLMVCALAACGSGKKDNKDSTVASQPNTSVGGNVSTGGAVSTGTGTAITIAFDFSGAEDTAVQHSSYNVFDGISVLTSTGVELKSRTTATSDCGMNGKLLNTSEVRTCKIDYVIDFALSGQQLHEEATRTVEIIEPTIVAGNLVSNPSFELGTQDWELATHEDAIGEFSVVKDNELNKNVAKVVIGGFNWRNNDSSPRLNSATYATNGSGADKRFTMTGGQNYKVSFKAKALAERHVNVSIGQLIPADPWYEGFTSAEQTYTAAVGTEWQTFEYTFAATHETLDGCSILFSMGVINVNGQDEKVLTTMYYTDIYVGVYNDQVTDEKAPTINGAIDATVTASSTPYDPLTGIYVTDNVDSDIVAKAYYNGAEITSLDISNPGKYTINYKAVDAAGNEATASRTITVVASGTNLLADINAARIKNDSWCETWVSQAITTDTDGSIKIFTKGYGKDSYINQININNLPCTAGNSYTLTFEVKSSVAFDVRFIENGNNWTEYGKVSVTPSDDFVTVTMTIAANNFAQGNKLTIELGTVATESNDEITFWVRNFNLVQN